MPFFRIKILQYITNLCVKSTKTKSAMENELIHPNSNTVSIIDIEQSTNLFDRRNTSLTAKECVTIARKTFKTNKTKSYKFRKAQLKKLQQMYNETEQEMYDVLSKDLHKPKQEASATEVEYLKNNVKYMLMHLKSWMQPKNQEKNLHNLLNKLQIYSDPLGVVLVIGAWNYPLQLTLLPLAGAIAGGNCVVIKPSELATASCKFLVKTLPRYLDSECYLVFEGGITETTELLKEKFDYIFFTGSPQVGKIVHQAAAQHLTPTTLELGGKNPTYIDSTANIEMVAARLLWGKCMNAGQLCIAPDYVLCSPPVQDQLIQACRKILIKWYGNNPKDSPDLSRIINDQHFNRLLNLIQNGKVAVGGDSDANERYVEPTILIDIKPEDAILNEEIFGPILPIITIKNVFEAVDYINSKEKPLAIYIFSSNKKDVEYILTSTSSGGVCVNDTLLQVTSENLPFGGVGNSGMGNYHGKFSFDIFVHKKSVLKKTFALIPEKMQAARYPPYNNFKMKTINFLLRKRQEFPTKLMFHILIFVEGMLVMYLLHHIF